VETTASPRRLIEFLGGMYSRELGIDLSEPDRVQIFRAACHRGRYPRAISWRPERPPRPIGRTEGPGSPAHGAGERESAGCVEENLGGGEGARIRFQRLRGSA